MSDGWAMKSIGELCEAPKLRKAEVGTVPYIEIGDVDVVSKLVNLKDKPAVKGSVLAPASSLLVSRVRPTRGAITLLNSTQAVSSAFLALQPKAGTNLRLLFYWLAYSDDFRAYLEGAQIGALYPSVREEDILKYRVNYPSDPAEQQRIVRLLDEAFEGIATAKDNAEKNLQNASAIFEGYLQAVFSQVSDAWINKRLGEISHIQYGYTESSSITKVGPHFLRITDIQDNNVNWDTVPYCPIEAGEFRKFQLHDGDIVFARTGATTGKSYLVSEPPDSVFASYLIRVQLQEKGLLPAFLNLYFQTQSYWDAIRAGVSGSAQGGFNATKLGELAIPFPRSIETQRSLVDKLQLLNGAVSNLKVVYEKKNAALNALTSSLLERAFSGAMKAG